MPRSGRGGRSEITPGTPVSNRSDLLAPTASPGQEYGQAGDQLSAQRLVPMAAAPTAPPSQPVAQPASPPIPAAGSMPFMEQSNRPEEPVTAGLPVGPGPGPEAMPTPTGDVARQLGTIATANSSPAIQRLADMAAHLGV